MRILQNGSARRRTMKSRTDCLFRKKGKDGKERPPRYVRIMAGEVLVVRSTETPTSRRHSKSAKRYRHLKSGVPVDSGDDRLF